MLKALRAFTAMVVWACATTSWAGNAAPGSALAFAASVDHMAPRGLHSVDPLLHTSTPVATGLAVAAGAADIHLTGDSSHASLHDRPEAASSAGAGSGIGQSVRVASADAGRDTKKARFIATVTKTM